MACYFRLDVSFSPQVWFSLLLIATTAILALCISNARERLWKLFLSLIVGILVYWIEFPTQFLWAAGIYVALLAIDILIPSRATARARWHASNALIALLVLAYCLLSYRGIRLHSSTANFQFVIVGLPNMWLLLRLISLAWEFGSGSTELPSVLDYVTWVLLPFTIMGPFLPFSAFRKEKQAIPPKWQMIDRSRLVLGTLQLTLSSLLGLSTPKLLELHSRPASLLVMLFTAPWSFYLLAAGVFHIMEALAPTWGLSLETSFKNPFAKQNIAEFWGAWNVTATNFFRDTLFYQRWGLRRQSVYLNLMILFAAVGVSPTGRVAAVTMLTQKGCPPSRRAQAAEG